MTDFRLLRDGEAIGTLSDVSDTDEAITWALQLRSTQPAHIRHDLLILERDSGSEWSPVLTLHPMRST